MSGKDKNASTVLVVDDFEDMRKVLRLWLESRGYRVVEAEDGDHAIEVARTVRPALILMDIGLPERSGISATYKIRKELGGIPIIAVSAFDTDLHEDALKAGCVACLPKPVDTNELEKLLNNLL
jgi:two-component system, cell cycle response regulator DivK